MQTINPIKYRQRGYVLSPDLEPWDEGYIYCNRSCWGWSRVVTAPPNFPFSPSNKFIPALLLSIGIQAVWELISTYNMLFINCSGRNIPSFWGRISSVTHLSLYATYSPHIHTNEVPANLFKVPRCVVAALSYLSPNWMQWLQSDMKHYKFAQDKLAQKY